MNPLKAVRFTSPIPSHRSNSPLVDGESFHDLSTAEQGLVSDAAFLPRKPEPAWIRLRQVLCGTARKPLPRTPPSSPYLKPERPFHAYPVLRHKLVEAANKCVSALIEDHERVQRNTSMGYHTQPRVLDVLVGPEFCFYRMPSMWLSEFPSEDGWVLADAFHQLDVAEHILGRDENVHWAQSYTFEHFSEAIHRLNRWCGKNGLENLRVCLTTSGKAQRIDGQARYRVSSIWLKTDAPDISASFSVPHELHI